MISKPWEAVVRAINGFSEPDKTEQTCSFLLIYLKKEIMKNLVFVNALTGPQPPDQIATDPSGSMVVRFGRRIKEGKLKFTLTH